jgi:ESF2/ABP1 family protein
VELAKQLEKRAEKKRAKGEEFQFQERAPKRPKEGNDDARWKKAVEETTADSELDSVLGRIF